MKRKSILQQMRWLRVFPRIAPLALASMVLFSPASYATYTYILGNSVSPITAGVGPSTDGTTTIKYASQPTVYFSRTSTLAPANVKINWNASHGSTSDNSNLFCTRSDQGTGQGLSIESNFISAGSYNGVEIFKTSIPGLYFSLRLRSFSSNGMATVTPTAVDITSGTSHNILKLTKATTQCDGTNTTGTINYANWGGFSFYSTITFYTDQTYTSGASSVSLLKTSDYHLRIWNENPGEGIKSYYKNILYDISSVIVAEPTCTTQPVASGSGVTGTTVDLGSYSPNDIINGAAAVPFSINLANCKALRNINVTLTTATPAQDPTMLGNILTINNASGVGVEISGATNSYSQQMVMIPNDATSVYNDQRKTSSDNNIYGTNESGTPQSQTLNFLATLKRDNNQKIRSGNFKANGTFTIDYP